MSEFTKDELETLYRALDIADLNGHEVDHHTIGEKLLYMIDNYCEHEFVSEYYIQQRVHQCTKCLLEKI